MADAEPLAGGKGNGVWRCGLVIRCAVPPTLTTRRSVSYLRLSGSGVEVPKRLGRDERGRGVFEWIDGEVPVPTYPAWALTDDALASTETSIWPKTLRQTRSRPR